MYNIYLRVQQFFLFFFPGFTGSSFLLTFFLLILNLYIFQSLFLSMDKDTLCSPASQSEYFSPSILPC